MEGCAAEAGLASGLIAAATVELAGSVAFKGVLEVMVVVASVPVLTAAAAVTGAAATLETPAVAFG